MSLLAPCKRQSIQSLRMSDQATSQLVLPIAGGNKASFENFWVGEHTELVSAIHACVQLGEPSLIYFYGPKSAGKSHLMSAVMRLAKAEVINTSYLCLAHPSASIELLETVDVHHIVCVDDIHLWAGDRQKERALFNLFEQIKHVKGQLLISAIAPPQKCEFEIVDLVSRLSSGLVYPLNALSDQQQFDAIQFHAKQRGLKIEDEVVRYLLSRSSRDTRELFMLLDKIDHASLVEQRRVTIPFLRSVLDI